MEKTDDDNEGSLDDKAEEVDGEAEEVDGEAEETVDEAVLPKVMAEEDLVGVVSKDQVDESKGQQSVAFSSGTHFLSF